MSHHDPTYAVIAKHRRALAIFEHQPSDATWADVYTARELLMLVVPSTIAGAAALATYLSQRIADDESFLEQEQDQLSILRSLAAALSRPSGPTRTR
jgi:hypothetical protein